MWVKTEYPRLINLEHVFEVRIKKIDNVTSNKPFALAVFDVSYNIEEKLWWGSEADCKEILQKICKALNEGKNFLDLSDGMVTYE